MRRKDGKYQDEFDEVADMNFDEIQKMALKDTQGLVDDINDSASTKTGWMIYLIILIPLYIISGYPRGYMISAHRRQHGFMRTLQKSVLPWQVSSSVVVC